MKRFFLALLPLALYYLISIPVWFLLTQLWGEGTENGKYALMQGIASLATLPVLLFLYRKDKMKEETHARFSGLFLLGGLSAGLLATALNNLLGMLRITEISQGWSTARESFYNGTLFSELIFLGILIPFVEELLYRGLVYGRLREIFSAPLALLLTTALFALLHFNLAQILYAAIIGLVLGLLREKFHSFLPAAFGHMIANLVAILRQEGILTLPETGGAAIALTALLAAAGGVLLLFLLRGKENGR